jgi:hypothetical protein
MRNLWNYVVACVLLTLMIVLVFCLTLHHLRAQCEAQTVEVYRGIVARSCWWDSDDAGAMYIPRP